MVGSLVLASEVLLLLLVPTSMAPTQIKCAKEILRYPYVIFTRIFEQSAIEEREHAPLLERNDDRHVLLKESEARLAPLEFFGQVEGDFAYLSICQRGVYADLFRWLDTPRIVGVETMWWCVVGKNNSIEASCSLESAKFTSVRMGYFRRSDPAM